MNTITVLLADDNAIIREGVLALLKLEDGIEVVGEVENGCQAVAAARQLCPDVVVMDISMPQLNGMEAARQILQAAPDTRVIILSAHHENAFISLVMAIGASGYLNKLTSVHELPAAIREVHQGRPFYRSPGISMLPVEYDSTRIDHGHAQDVRNGQSSTAEALPLTVHDDICGISTLDPQATPLRLTPARKGLRKDHFPDDLMQCTLEN
ncbi:MAG: response regulator transcription factor [Prosthecobacter sp.]|uniref:response regulator n=1 Tax=Prosthecobacter sp. TaxID=1965333 RepID=UPI0025E092C5|nr:response regulator transcription factor [Prosthecobacter sp.]MCF7786844.1 response regulator transcription factor [Prosthecobacter sp.]